jgi:cysteine synthase A
MKLLTRFFTWFILYYIPLEVIAMLYESVTQLIGNTPLLHLTAMKKAMKLSAEIYAKLEGCNPAGSVKDRAALSMIEAAEKQGLLKPDSVIIEPTSGNTGIGLAAIATARGYRCIIVMPDSMSVERQLLMAAYGAEVVLTPAEEGMPGAVAAAKALADQYPFSFLPDQFCSQANAQAHYDTTGPEIWQDTQGAVDIFVAGAGTGGTLTGAGRFLKEQNPQLRVVAVEPADSPVLSGGKPGKHGIQGIGPGFIPEVLDQSVIDQIFTVSQEDAINAARGLARRKGLLVGISSGAALHAAFQLLKEHTEKTVVAVLPDSGERYLSTGIFG